MQSDKKSVQILATILRQKGIRDIIFSPGSRNAPLVLQLANDAFFNTCCLPDERCAAFFALGMSQWNRKPTVICCTSGSATLNYAPAIAEAYYQNIPLLVVTADRPLEWIDHGEGQSIRQDGIYANYIKGSYTLPQDYANADNEWHCNRIINEAINLSLSEEGGPVHINMPFSEPLYRQSDLPAKDQRLIEEVYPASEGLALGSELVDMWNRSRKLIICGLMPPDNRLNQQLVRLTHDPNVAILTETTSNQISDTFCTNIDRLLASIGESETETFIPDLLITIGGPIVSKRIKAFFRKHKPENHWHIGRQTHHQDVFQNLTHSIYASPTQIFGSLEVQSGQTGYGALWLKKHWETRVRHEAYISQLPYSDLSVYRDVLDFIPDDSVIHMSNSTAVRYVQLFDPIRSALYMCNRGTSGIDGSTSTALGNAFVNGRNNVFLTGDMSFIYDSNAFWNIPPDICLKIVIVNNNGGGIFRIIDGPDGTPNLKRFFEVEHKLTARGIAEMYGWSYATASSTDELTQRLETFLDFSVEPNGILEVFTDPETNPQILKDYFKTLK